MKRVYFKPVFGSYPLTFNQKDIMKNPIIAASLSFSEQYLMENCFM